MQNDSTPPAINQDTNPTASANPADTPQNSIESPLQPPTEPEQKSGWDTFKSLLSTLGIFLLAPLVAILLTAFVFQSYEVDGQSMERTLQDKDRLIVYKLPRTWSRMRGQHYQPVRGDVVVFTKSGAFEGASNRQLIKRVIGVPGDHVVVKDGVVTIFNQANPTGFNPDENQSYSENLPPTTEGNIDITVDEGHVFVLGDNRSNSQDSRIFGPIDTETISGTLLLRIFPFDSFESY